MTSVVSSVNLYCSDLDRSSAFYRDLIGVPLDESHGHEPENRRHCEAMFGDLESLYVFFVLFEAEADERTMRADVGFRVPDLDAAHEVLTSAGTPVVFGPREVPWGREAKYLDPDGNHVTLGSG